MPSLKQLSHIELHATHSFELDEKNVRDGHWMNVPFARAVVAVVHAVEDEDSGCRPVLQV